MIRSFVQFPGEWNKFEVPKVAIRLRRANW